MSVFHIRADLARIQKPFRIEYRLDALHQLHHITANIVLQTPDGNSSDIRAFIPLPFA